jgi:steroid delta-isomerase-like uncharacterized protein
VGRTKRDWLQECLSAWSSQDSGRIASFFVEKCVCEDVATGIVYLGRGELEAFVGAIFAAFPDLTLDIRRGFRTGRNSTVEWIMRGTHRQSSAEKAHTSNKTMCLLGCSIAEYDGGHIKRLTNYYDRAAFLRQLGILPADAFRGQGQVLLRNRPL